ncbi:uroporphyrinogen-III synthase [Glutamicibacter endophyticus]
MNAPSPQSTLQAAPLAGFRIAVTSDRRSQELVEALERRGALVEHTPLLKLAPLDNEEQLLSQTRQVIAQRPHLLLVTTGYGFRRWFDSAEAAGLGESLTRVLSDAQIHVRGAKALGAVRALGFTAASVGSDGLTSTLLRDLASDIRGKKVAIQWHADSDPDLIGSLHRLGARDLVEVEPYRWVDSAREESMIELVHSLIAGRLDAVTFTSAPAVHALFAVARSRGSFDALTRSLRERVTVATVGPVTAAPLQSAGVEPLIPERHRMGAMILQLIEHLGTHGTLSCQTALGACQLRGHTLYVEDQSIELGQAQAEVFRRLLDAGGAVVSRAELVSLLPSVSSNHALDMAVSRLRKSLPDPTLVSTVIKRGYRLNV